MVGSPHTWEVGTLIQNPAGIFNMSYWEDLRASPPVFASSAIVISVRAIESSVPSFIVTLMMPDGHAQSVMCEALSITHII